MKNNVIVHYLIYSLIFVIINFSSISVVAFFHFLLGHELSVIEYWLNRNGWEVLIFSKVLASIVFLSFFTLNFSHKSLHKELLSFDYRPTWNGGAIILYFLITTCFCFYFLGDFKYGKNTEDFLYTSFLGSILYYFTDYLVVLFILKAQQMTEKMRVTLTLYLSLLFFISTKIALPYTSQYYLFIFLHFLTLLVFHIRNQKNLMNPLLYAIIIIGPLSSFFGVDLVWDNTYSPYQINRSNITVSILFIWVFGLIFHYKRKTN